MPDLTFPEDFGYANVTIGAVTQRLDLYAVHARISEETAKYKSSPSELGKAWAALVEEFGFPRVSQYTAKEFVVAMTNLVDDLKKKEIPESTGNANSPSSGSPSSP